MLTDVEKVRLRIFDIPKNPWYPVLTDPEIQQLLDDNNGAVLPAARDAARTISLFFATVNTKEKYGDVEVWNEAARRYTEALNSFINDPNIFSSLPKGLMPYAAGISLDDMYQSLTNPDNPLSYNVLAMAGIHSKYEDWCNAANSSLFTLPE